MPGPCPPGHLPGSLRSTLLADGHRVALGFLKERRLCPPACWDPVEEVAWGNQGMASGLETCAQSGRAVLGVGKGTAGLGGRRALDGVPAFTSRTEGSRQGAWPQCKVALSLRFVQSLSSPPHSTVYTAG